MIFLYAWTITLSITLCQCCEPGVATFAQWLTKRMDVSALPQPLRIASRDVTASSTKIFHNGTILTMANGNYSSVDAVVLSNDTIMYTGSLDGATKSAGSGAQSVDLQGRSVLPGFIEPHLHLILTALADNYLLNLSPLMITTLDQAKAVIQAAVANNTGSGVAGYGYDPSRVDGHPDLTVDVLDSISRNVSIFILNQSGHVAYANTVALTAAGVTAASVADDSNYQQVNGTLTGILFEQAVSAVGSKVDLPGATDMVKYCLVTLQKWMSLGCTTIFDAGIGSVGTTDVPLLAAVPATPIRFHGALSSLILTNLGPLIQPPPFKLGAIDITSIKFWADGSTQGFTAYLNSPYLDPPPYMSPYGVKNYANASVLSTAMTSWLRAGFQLVVHSNGDASTDMVLDAYNTTFSAVPSRNTTILHRIEHFTVTEPTQLMRAKALGLSVSHTIGHVNYWGATFTNYVLGQPRAAYVDPLLSDTNMGLVWSLHSDSPVTPVNPILYLKTATTRMLYPDGTGVLGESERVDLLTALKAITVNPARQIGVDGLVGTLEPGKKADMVILDRDPRTVELASLDTLVVEQTWIGGVMVYQNIS